MSRTLEQAAAHCPKRMHYGPCGGVDETGGCEVDRNLPCPYLTILEDLPWRHPQLLRKRPEQRSQGRLENDLREGRFVLVAEAYTPDSANLDPLVHVYAAMAERITAVNIAEHALATPHTSTLAAAARLEQAGVETILNLTCRDRNRIALQGELLGAAALGVKNLFCITGDHPALGDHPTTPGVFELDGHRLIALARTLCDEGVLGSGRVLSVAPRLFIGCAANPFSSPVNLQAERVAAKVALGADFIQTQAVFDLVALERFIADLGNFGVLARAFLIVGIAVVGSLEQALWLRQRVPGACVPAELIRLLERTPARSQREVGLSYTVRLVRTLQRLEGVSGALLFPLLGDVAALGEVLEQLTL